MILIRLFMFKPKLLLMQLNIVISEGYNLKYDAISKSVILYKTLAISVQIPKQYEKVIGMLSILKLYCNSCSILSAVAARS